MRKSQITTNKSQIFLILHDIRSVHNVGSMFRTADGVGVSKIYITGYTPAPVDRFGRNVAAFSKVSLGAENSVPWEKRSSVLELIQELKKDGARIIALEQTPTSLHYGDVKLGEKVALIVGNEVGGISKEVLARADIVMDIPMRGAKESLNVSVATGIALYALTNS